MKIATARKEHLCSLCGQPIPVGDRYWSDHDPDTLTTRKEHCNCEEYSVPVTAQPPQGAA